jgi:hypothetical protein
VITGREGGVVFPTAGEGAGVYDTCAVCPAHPETQAETMIAMNVMMAFMTVFRRVFDKAPCFTLLL